MIECDEEFEINRPHSAGRLYNFLISYKFQKALNVLPFPIKKLSLLDICCGSGMISEYYVRVGAKVTGIDISSACIERAKIRSQKYGFSANFQLANSVNLPFPDNSFDIVSVHDGLHHLDDPQRAIKEMVRVAKKGIVIIEPAKALLTRISVFLGFSRNYESTNYVYRFRKNELISWLKKSGTKEVIIKRYIMYYPHKPGKFFRIFDTTVLFFIVNKIFRVINLLFGRLGNKIQAIGLK